MPLSPLEGKSKSHALHSKIKKKQNKHTQKKKTNANEEMHEELKWQFLWDQAEKHSDFYCLLVRDQLQSINDLIT